MSVKRDEIMTNTQMKKVLLAILFVGAALLLPELVYSEGRRAVGGSLSPHDHDIGPIDDGGFSADDYDITFSIAGTITDNNFLIQDVSTLGANRPLIEAEVRTKENIIAGPLNNHLASEILHKTQGLPVLTGGELDATATSCREDFNECIASLGTIGAMNAAAADSLVWPTTVKAEIALDGVGFEVTADLSQPAGARSTGNPVSGFGGTNLLPSEGGVTPPTTVKPVRPGLHNPGNF